MNKVRSDINHIQDVVNAFIPPFQQESLIFNGPEINSVINAINSTRNEFQIVEFAEFLFAISLINSDKLSDSG